MADSGVFSGRLTDGRSASSRMVTVRLARALELDPGGAVPETWAFHRLRPAVPLGKRSADVLLSSQDHPGATLFVAEPAFVKAILAVAPQLSQTAERWRYAKPALLATAVVGLIAAAVYAFDLSPAAGIARMLPHDVRVLIGEQSVKSFTSGHKFCNAPAGTQALDAMAKKLSDAAGPGARFSVKVVDWDMVNAFAMPGEQVVLMRGLIEKAENPDEVAGVLAHEMGHGLALHPEAGIIRAIGIAAGMEMVLTGSSGTLGNIGGMLLQMQFTRQAETDADTHALELLRGARILADGTGASGTNVNPGIIVSDANTAARRLYERCGYRETARRPKVKEDWQTTGTEWVLMVKPL